ncbi:hypothetical protein [Haloplasma contractile]|uniref:Uncharacterized protein n=1 Tax=Haloplasma contractile SSD-17B TaxID=1033810 RepID=U2EF71_9MOLU|nr:hypothetical protein [Haloplasma contractile]ERJ13578.1 hypothetical protein HLPCO_000244 [Haloplasma contractile SSD-17B]
MKNVLCVLAEELLNYVMVLLIWQLILTIFIPLPLMVILLILLGIVYAFFWIISGD